MRKVCITICFIILLLLFSGCTILGQKYNILGKYNCSNDTFNTEPFIEYPDYISAITFYEYDFCILRVNYMHGTTEANCSYEIKRDIIKVKVDLYGTLLYGTDNTGKTFMEDEYIFNIIDDNTISIDKGFYAVNDNDIFKKIKN